MAKKAQMGDFIGFCFNNIHSSELGLVRISDGNRYEKNLFPAISDKTVQVPGRDGFYYFGSSYNSREITIKVAFDNLEENEFREMVEHFKDKKPHFLWFDELPYKEYLVKIKNSPNFKYLCFDEWIEEEDGNGEIMKRKARIYKGEGTIIFVCYSPYARARVKSLDEEINQVIIKKSSYLPDYYHNTYLNGDNKLDDNNVPELPPRIMQDGNYLTTGQDIRKLIDGEYLTLKDSFGSNDNKFNVYSIYENLAFLYLIGEEINDLLEVWTGTNISDIDSFIDSVGQNENNFESLLKKLTTFILNTTINLNNSDQRKVGLWESYNFKEWYEFGKLPLFKNEIEENKKIIIRNCGDINMDTKILLTNLNLEDVEDKCIVELCPIDGDGNDREAIGSITIDKRKLLQQLDRYGLQGKDRSKTPYKFFFLDSKTKLLQAYDTCIEDLDGYGKPKRDEYGNIMYKYSNYSDPWGSERETKSVFNNCIVAGDFFKIPADDNKYRIKVTNGTLKDVEYTYLYY